MKWETKYNAYNAILEFDKGRPINTSEKNQEIRFAKRLKSLSENEEIKRIADIMIEGKFESLAEKQSFIDEKFIPAIEKDLEDTMNLLGGDCGSKIEMNIAIIDLSPFIYPKINYIIVEWGSVPCLLQIADVRPDGSGRQCPPFLARSTFTCAHLSHEANRDQLGRRHMDD